MATGNAIDFCAGESLPHTRDSKIAVSQTAGFHTIDNEECQFGHESLLDFEPPNLQVIGDGGAGIANGSNFFAVH